MTHLVMVPGIGGSEPDHWQSQWQDRWQDDRGTTAASRIVVDSWDAPVLENWVDAVVVAVAKAAGPGVMLIGHSLGCLAIASALTRGDLQVAGAFLVAPPDTNAPAFPSAQAASFVQSIGATIGVPALMITSDDDPYCAPSAATRLATQWAIPRVSVGDVGHLNVSSGVGDWLTGRHLLAAFAAGLGLGPLE